MRRSLMVVALTGLVAVPSDAAFGFSKTAQKVAFATGLLAFGGVVRALIRRDRDHTAERVRELRAEWGDPVQVIATIDGFDTIRVERYERDGRSAWATFRNGRLVHVRYARGDAGDDAGSLDGGGHRVGVHVGRPLSVRPNP